LVLRRWLREAEKRVRPASDALRAARQTRTTSAN
jgi:hypothetical protein